MVQYKTPKEVFALHFILDLDMHDENKIKTRMSIHVHELQKRCMMLIESNQTLCLIVPKVTGTHSNTLHLSFTSTVACFRESVGFVIYLRDCIIFCGISSMRQTLIDMSRVR